MKKHWTILLAVAMICMGVSSMAAGDSPDPAITVINGYIVLDGHKYPVEDGYIIRDGYKVPLESHIEYVLRSRVIHSYTPEMTADLTARLDALRVRFGDALSGEERFQLFCLREHIATEPCYPDYDACLAALNACGSAEDVSTLLRSGYGFLGTFPQMDIEGVAKELASQFEFSGMRYYAYLPGYRGESYTVYVGDDAEEHGDPVSPFVRYLQFRFQSAAGFRNRRFSLEQNVVMSQPVAFTQSRPLTAAELDNLSAKARQSLAFTEANLLSPAYSDLADEAKQTIGEAAGDIRASEYAYASEMGEDVAWIWIHRTTGTGPWLLAGLETGRIYRFVSHMSEFALEGLDLSSPVWSLHDCP